MPIFKTDPHPLKRIIYERQEIPPYATNSDNQIQNGVTKSLVQFNYSRIAIGVLIIIALIYLKPDIRQTLGSLPLLILLLLMVISAFATSIERFEDVANVALGASMFLIAYQLPEVKQMFIDGRIALVFFFLVLVAILMQRSRHGA